MRINNYEIENRNDKEVLKEVITLLSVDNINKMINRREKSMKNYDNVPMAIVYRNHNWEIVSQFEFTHKSFDIENTSMFIDVSHKDDKYHRPDGRYEIIYCIDCIEIPEKYRDI